MEFVDKLKRIYALSKRIAKAVLPEAVAKSRITPNLIGLVLNRVVPVALGVEPVFMLLGTAIAVCDVLAWPL